MSEPELFPAPEEPASGASFRSPEQVARRSGLSRKAIYRAIARGELSAYRLCGRLRIAPQDEQRWLEANRVSVHSPGPLRRPSAARPGPPAHSLRRLLEEAEQPTGLVET